MRVQNSKKVEKKMVVIIGLEMLPRSTHCTGSLGDWAQLKISDVTTVVRNKTEERKTTEKVSTLYHINTV